MGMRHWRQKFSTDAPMVFRKRVNVGYKVFEPGEALPDDLREQMGSRLRSWWNAKLIQLAPSHDPDVIRAEAASKARSDATKAEAAKAVQLAEAIRTGEAATAALEASDSDPDNKELAKATEEAIALARAAAAAYDGEELEDEDDAAEILAQAQAEEAEEAAALEAKAKAEAEAAEAEEAARAAEPKPKAKPKAKPKRRAKKTTD